MIWKSSACENTNGHKITETAEKIINDQITEKEPDSGIHCLGSRGPHCFKKKKKNTLILRLETLCFRGKS